MILTKSLSPISFSNNFYIFIIILTDLIKPTIKLLVSNLKWACNFLLHQSFFHHQLHVVHQNVNELESSHIRIEPTSLEQMICVICLSTIREDEDIREVRCGHLFHVACLDRWSRFGNTTCPLCRVCLVLPIVSKLGHEMLEFDFCSSDETTNEGSWWLR
ncbi:hypothetical protein QVD17_29169 [Tagetes erecta]|uniref:RING-type domain-containing protein n=1 Tax=Tagetes erecta TaxID=13708 RepID=A0AAD8KEE1_TARER|nr:hypothetical protein QVD17_29169 [Tagetes erecta]